jgi:hypothetical protein
MKNRYLVLGLSVILALAFAVPALGGPTNPVASISATAKQIAQKALKKANKAQKTATAAQTAANNAQSAANSAQSSANGAKSTADKAQTSATAANTAAGKAQTTANTALTTANAAAAAAKAAQDTANTKVTKGTNFEEGEDVAASGGSALAVAGCPSGEQPSGGGYAISGTDATKARVGLSSQYLSAWIVEADNISGLAGNNWALSSIAICMG